MDQFSRSWLEVIAAYSGRIVAWCVLPNHYHALVETENVLRLLWELGRFHGRTSHAWNTEEDVRGRKVFHRAVERFMRSDRHFWATVNYIHHNPVHHRYVEQWTDWPWSSAAEYLQEMGRDKAALIWREYPVRDYGKDWDPVDV
jgi:putative transposase